MAPLPLPAPPAICSPPPPELSELTQLSMLYLDYNFDDLWAEEGAGADLQAELRYVPCIFCLWFWPFLFFTILALAAEDCGMLAARAVVGAHSRGRHRRCGALPPLCCPLPNSPLLRPPMCSRGLGPLTQLRALGLSHTAVEGWPDALNGFRQLRVLYLERVPISEVGEVASHLLWGTMHDLGTLPEEVASHRCCGQGLAASRHDWDV